MIQRELKPEEGENVSFCWSWTNDPVWVRVTVDQKNKIPELCEANNERCELNIGRALRWGYRETTRQDDYKNKKINCVGSFSYFDWFNAEHVPSIFNALEQCLSDHESRWCQIRGPRG